MKKSISLFLACVFATAAFALGFGVYTNATLTATTAKAAPANTILAGVNISNVNTYPVYVQFFDAATTGAVTLGSTAPKFWIAVPTGGVTDDIGAGGPGFTLGMVIAVTTTPTGNTAPATSVPTTLYLN